MTGKDKALAHELIYEGSVKRLWLSPQDSNLLWFEFSDDYSIFDWGKMPDTISNKGRALTYLGALFFEKLADRQLWSGLGRSDCFRHMDRSWLDERLAGPLMDNLQKAGLGSHFRRLVCGEKTLTKDLFGQAEAAEPLYLEVERAAIPPVQPAVVDGRSLFFYGKPAEPGNRRLIPLEVVFRFGMPAGSSLAGKLASDPGYLEELQLQSMPEPGEWLARPVLEFFTKLEPTDRRLAWSEAAVLSGLSPEQFESLVEKTYLIALFLFHTFASSGIELWDGKLEFIFDSDADSPVLLADSIGPDELRLLYRGQHLSKELIRTMYRGSDWAAAVAEAKEIARRRATTGWKEICRQELGQEPLPLSPPLKEVVDLLYGVIVNRVMDRVIFDAHPDLDGFVEMLEQVAPEESRTRLPAERGPERRAR